MTRGPIHEAFAAPVVHDPKASPMIDKQPPAPIQEEPPDQKPAGQNVQWIPGYWNWDVSRNDFIWVSGIWREPPPNSQWVPGYWHDVDGGHQWVAGTWIPVSTAQSQNQQSYLPSPPASLEAGPNSPPPSANVNWTPGFWSWQASGYIWRPGFWAAVQPNWIWMPAHYVYSPSGYIFVPGYWDLPVANRGLMFAPVYYPQPVYAAAGFRLYAVNQHRWLGRDGQPVRAGEHQPVPFWKFLRSELCECRNHTLVLFLVCNGSAGLLRPAVFVLRSDQRAAKSGLDSGRPGAVRSSSRAAGTEACEHVHRANAHYRAKCDYQP